MSNLRVCSIVFFFFVIFQNVDSNAQTKCYYEYSLSDYRLHAKHSCFNIFMYPFDVRQNRLGYQDLNKELSFLKKDCHFEHIQNII